MKDMEFHPLPSTGDVFKEQTRTMGLALRPLGIGVAIFLVANGAFVLYRSLVDPATPAPLPTDALAWMSFVGMGLPLFLGRGSVTPFRPGLPWTLPVGRARHALIRVAAAWIWLMVGVGALLVWYVGVHLMAGSAMREPMLYLVAPFSNPRPAEPGSLPTVLWSFPWWIWLVPFLATTALYCWTSALFLATRHPGRWLMGTLLGMFLLALFANRTNFIHLFDWVDPALMGLLEGRFGFFTLTAGGAVPAAWVDLPAGGRMPMFVGMPTFGRWLVASGLWISMGIGLMCLAALRHRDGSGAWSGR